MIKLILKDSFLYTISNLLTKGIGFLMLPIYTKFFSPSEFGTLDLLLVTGNILSIIVGLEIHQAVARFFPEAADISEKKSIVSTAFWVILFFYIMALFISLVFTSYISVHFFKVPGSENLVRVAFLSYGFNFLYYFSSNQLRWQLKTKENVFVSVIYSVVSALGAFILLKFFHQGLMAVFASQILAASLGLILSIMFAREYYGWGIDRFKMKELIKFSTPLVFSTLVVYAMLYVDRMLINSYLNKEDLGYYAFAYRIASVVSLLTVGIQSALTPIVYNNYKNEDCARQIAHFFHLFLIGSMFFVTLLFLFSGFLVKMIGSVKYLGASSLIPWVALSMLFTGVTNFTPGIFIEKKTHHILAINLFSFLSNAVLGFFGIKYFGLIGTVCATAFCSILYFLLYYLIGQKYYFIPFFWTKLKSK